MLRRLALPIVATLCLIAIWWVATAPVTPTAAETPALEQHDDRPQPQPQPTRPAPTIATAKPAPAPEPIPSDPEPVRTPEAPSSNPTPEPARAQPQVAPPVLLTPEGPVAELQQQFESETRASSAHTLEKRIEQVFDQPSVSPQLLESVTCRQTVCKVEVGWSQQRMKDYMVALSGLLPVFNPRIAVSPVTSPDAEGIYAVTVYVSPKQE
jgi:hypothetical protein